MVIHAATALSGLCSTSDVTGVLLAGGRGQRMGGVDKGLQPFRGRAMAQEVLARLSPQVSNTLINANRHQDEYAQWGHPVFGDDEPALTFSHSTKSTSEAARYLFAGPLAGMLAALERCPTPWLVTVPCDSPFLPIDLVTRLLAAAQAQQANVALPVTPRLTPIHNEPQYQWQTVFLLLHQNTRHALRDYLARGERKIETWVRSQTHVLVPFSDEACFANINTQEELDRFNNPL